MNREVNFPFFLAPMVGLSHVGLRMLVRRYLPQGAITLWPTEMLNSRRLPHQRLGETPETLKADEEDYLLPQILGNEEGPIALSVQKLEEWGAKAIDINMGCPVKKALKHNYGVALMGDTEYAAEVVRMTVAHSRLPVSVKLRAGHQSDQEFLRRFVLGVEKAGAAWICLHPRFAAQKRRGKADWSQIKYVKEILEIPVIGNGDVQIAEDALRMMEETGCDGVMIGRALTARPWIFWQLGRHLGFANPPGLMGDPPQTPEEEAQAYGESLRYYLKLLKRFFPSEELGLRKLRFHLTVSHVWLNYGHQLAAGVSALKTYDEIDEFLVRFFQSANDLRFSIHTDLRY